MKAIYLLILGLLSLSGSAWAQNCPNGIPSAGNPGCIPPGNSASPYYENYSAPQPIRLRWKKTWGAIATDDESGVIGVTVGHFSKREAKRDAIAKCASTGARNCKLSLAYENQCVAIARPTFNGELIAGTAVMQGGSSVDVVTKLVLASCAKKQEGGGECKVIYSDCTSPVLVR